MRKALPQQYLGYGLLGSEEFVTRLLGRSLGVGEGLLTVQGYSLKKLHRSDLPQAVQEMTPEGFKIYGLVESFDSEDGVQVLRLQLSQEEMEVVNELNFGNHIYDRRVKFLPDCTEGLIDVFKFPGRGEFVGDASNYDHFLNGKEGAMTLANNLRVNVLAPLLETNHRGVERG